MIIDVYYVRLRSVQGVVGISSAEAEKGSERTVEIRHPAGSMWTVQIGERKGLESGDQQWTVQVITLGWSPGELNRTLAVGRGE